MGMLVRINKIKPPYHLKKGQKLLLPDKVRGIKNVRGKVGRTTNLKLQRVLGRTRSPKSFNVSETDDSYLVLSQISIIFTDDERTISFFKLAKRESPHAFIAHVLIRFRTSRYRSAG